MQRAHCQLGRHCSCRPFAGIAKEVRGHIEAALGSSFSGLDAACSALARQHKGEHGLNKITKMGRHLAIAEALDRHFTRQGHQKWLSQFCTHLDKQTTHEAEQFADEDDGVNERLDTKNEFDGYPHSRCSAAEGPLRNKGLSDKLDEKEATKLIAVKRLTPTTHTYPRRDPTALSRTASTRARSDLTWSPRSSFRKAAATLALRPWELIDPRASGWTNASSCNEP